MKELSKEQIDCEGLRNNLWDTQIGYDYKQEVIKFAIQGMIQNGMQKDIAEAFYLLFERIYNSGYNEARRNIEENPRDWGAY